MKKEIRDLVSISNHFGSMIEFTIAGGGNASYKDHEKIWIKPSGTTLADIKAGDFAVLYRDQIKEIAGKTYSKDPVERERQVKEDLMKANADPNHPKRPSVETSLHELIEYPFVVHLHPTFINALLCSREAKKNTGEFFGPEALFIEYTDPGYTLFKLVDKRVREYRDEAGHDPKIIFLQNHGIFVCGDNTKDIREIYELTTKKIQDKIREIPRITKLPVNEKVLHIIPALRVALSEKKLKNARIKHDSLIARYYAGKDAFKKISVPFIPDTIVYCKSKYLFINETGTGEEIIDTTLREVKKFRDKNRYLPKVILIRDLGLITFGENCKSAETVMDMYYDLIKIAFYSENFGGPNSLNEKQIEFIDEWEVENYRRKIAIGEGPEGKAENKIAIVTGSAQGIGAGIARNLFMENANVVISDIKSEDGTRLANELNEKGQKNRAVYIEADVSDPVEVKKLILTTVQELGGLDILISNAGILSAGTLEDMKPEVFENITNINYTGFFLCTKYASSIMKRQNRYKPGMFTDIIQINSKSGLQGSKKNFAYAGGKFGGIGLTQSFALELAEHNIKVNAVCPGNYFEGPLWSDPDTGLFVQYLKAGKVPGAKTIEDVRRYYEEQPPLRRGCEITDIMKAIYYIIDQKYETGQAIPVTGGQVMLG